MAGALIPSMYKDVRNRVRVGDGCFEEFCVRVGVHESSVFSLLIFIMLLDSLSMEFRTSTPWELVYGHYLMISAECMEQLLLKFKT